jgi:formamidopyrimidine-DNA glycosylase
MPELPEVEVARRNLRRWTKGRRVRDAEAGRTSIVRAAGGRDSTPSWARASSRSTGSASTCS